MVARVLAQDLFVHRVSLSRCTIKAGGSPDYVVAIPVRNEAELLPRCLNALERGMMRSAARGRVVIAVHDTRDRSYDLARDWMLSHAIPGVILDCRLDPDIRNAPHARRIALDIAAGMAGDGVLVSTDADSRIGPGLVARVLDECGRGRDMVCEDVRLDEAELAALPDHVRKVEDAERAYFTAVEALWSHWQPEGGRFAHRASGASMAVTAAAYRALGGLPVPPAGEDTALCEAAVGAGYSVTTVPDCGTRTSARIEARAQGGCGEALSRRSSDADPLCDRRLPTVERLRHLAERARLQGRSRLPQMAEARALRYSEVREQLAIARRILGWRDEG